MNNMFLGMILGPVMPLIAFPVLEAILPIGLGVKEVAKTTAQVCVPIMLFGVLGLLLTN